MASHKWYSEEGNSEYTAELEEHDGDLDTQKQRRGDYHHGDERHPTSLRGSRSSQPPPRTLRPTPGYNGFSYGPPMEYAPSQPHYVHYGNPTQYTAEPAPIHREPERNHQLDLPPDGYPPHQINRNLIPGDRTSAERVVNFPVNTVSQMGVQHGDHIRPNPVRQRLYLSNRGSREYLDASSLDIGGNQRTQYEQPGRGVSNYDSPWQQESRPFRAPPSQPPSMQSMQEPYSFSSSNSQFQRRGPCQYPGEDDEEIEDTSSHRHMPTPTRPILPRDDSGRYDSDPRGRNPFSREPPRVPMMDKPLPPASNSRVSLSRDNPAIRVVDRDGRHMELKSLLDTGNKLGHLVSSSAIDDLKLWREVNRNIIRTGTTLAGTLGTLGSIDLDYYVGDDRNYRTDTFHIFDDHYYKSHDILFSPGTEDNNPVAMVAFDKRGETEGTTTTSSSSLLPPPRIFLLGSLSEILSLLQTVIAIIIFDPLHSASLTSLNTLTNNLCDHCYRV